MGAFGDSLGPTWRLQIFHRAKRDLANHAAAATTGCVSTGLGFNILITLGWADIEIIPTNNILPAHHV